MKEIIFKLNSSLFSVEMSKPGRYILGNRKGHANLFIGYIKITLLKCGIVIDEMILYNDIKTE